MVVLISTDKCDMVHAYTYMHLCVVLYMWMCRLSYHLVCVDSLLRALHIVTRIVVVTVSSLQLSAVVQPLMLLKMVNKVALVLPLNPQ